MCLDKLKKFKTTGIGYKVVRKIGKKYCSVVFGCEKKAFYTKKWNKDTSKGKIKMWVEYRKGYHIFTTLKSAQRFWGKAFPVKKVEYRKVVATGKQTGKYVVVAREFRFID